MRRRRIGSGGFDVGAVGLGGMGLARAYASVGADRDVTDQTDDGGIALVRHAIELGSTLMDTADVYGPYSSELQMGRALRGLRDEVVLAGKCGLVTHEQTGLTTRNGRPAHIRRACDASLRRLQTDRIDLYQLHRVDPQVPIEETWGAMAGLVAAGKVRALGLAELPVCAQLDRVQGIFPVTSVQAELSVWSRQALEDVLPWCTARGVGFLACAPLGRGYLTGTLSLARFPLGDLRCGHPRFSPEAMTANRRIVWGIRAVARRHDATPAQVALAWVLAQGAQVVPIPGTTRIRHLEMNIRAADLDLTKEDLVELDALPPAVESAC